jgi:ribosomal protein S18 acetylase RimI-like enzyme
VAGTEAAAQAWRHATHAATCDVIRPWEHGTVVRATRYPDYYDFNLVRVERDPAMSVDDLVAFTDDALTGLAHRRIDFEAGDAPRAELESRGWRCERLVWMRHEQPLPPARDAIEVEEVPYEAVDDLRVAWYHEDYPGQDPTAYHAAAREVAERRAVQVLVAREGGVPIGYAQLEREGRGAEVTQVYVRPDHRGGGRGTAMTRAAIEAGSDADDLWIVADDEGRPKELYARLGFRAAWTTVECTLWP